jgi:hypothetical protein
VESEIIDYESSCVLKIIFLYSDEGGGNTVRGLQQPCRPLLHACPYQYYDDGLLTKKNSIHPQQQLQG